MIFTKLFFTCAFIGIMSILGIRLGTKIKVFEDTLAILAMVSTAGFIVFGVLSIWF